MGARIVEVLSARRDANAFLGAPPSIELSWNFHLWYNDIVRKKPYTHTHIRVYSDP